MITLALLALLCSAEPAAGRCCTLCLLCCEEHPDHAAVEMGGH